MKITRIAAYRVELPLHEGSYKWSGGKSVDGLRQHRRRGSRPTRASSATARSARSGRSTCRPTPRACGPGIAELGPHLLGEDPRELGKLNRRMDAALKGHPYVKSGIDMACWDILGQAAGLPVCDAARRPLRRRLRPLPRHLAGVAGGDGGEGRGLPRRGLPPLPAQGRRRPGRRHRAHPRRRAPSCSPATGSSPTPTPAGCMHEAVRVVRGGARRRRLHRAAVPHLRGVPGGPPAHRPSRSCSTRRSTASDMLLRAHADRAMDVVNLKISKLGGLTQGAAGPRPVRVARASR